MKSVIIPYYEINALLYEEILAKFSYRLVETEPVSCFLTEKQHLNKQDIYINREERALILQEDVINYLTGKAMTDYKHYWRQIMCSVNDKLDETKPYKAAYQPWFANMLVYQAASKLDLNLSDRLTQFELEYEEAIDENNKLIAHDMRFGDELNVIYKIPNCDAYDIHKAHAGAILEIAPELSKKINQWNVESKKDARKKDIVNIFVGKLAEKDQELKNECRRLRAIGVVADDELLAPHEKTYYWVCNRTRNKLRDFEKQALGLSGSFTVYANTDGLIVHNSKPMQTGDKVDEWGHEYHGDVYVCHIKGGWILQYGDKIKSNIKLTERFGTDLRIGKVPVMQSNKRVDWQILEIKEHEDELWNI